MMPTSLTAVFFATFFLTLLIISSKLYFSCWWVYYLLRLVSFNWNWWHSNLQSKAKSKFLFITGKGFLAEYIRITLY